MPPDASRQMPPGARCRQMPVARYQLPDVPPPRPSGGLGEVSRAPVLMSSALISGDVLPPSVLGPPDCDDERRAPAVKSGVPLLATMSDVLPPSSLGSSLLSMSAVQRFCSVLSFHRRDFHHLRSLGQRPQRRRTANRRFRPWRPVAAANSLFPAPSAHGGGRRTRSFRRAACWLWLPSCRSFEVL